MKTVIVPVSGGKDSQVVLSLALDAGYKPVCEHQNTGYDHPATYQQMRDMEAFYGVTIVEDEWAANGNPRKFIKVHRVWDVRKFLTGPATDLPEAAEECGYCSI